MTDQEVIVTVYYSSVSGSSTIKHDQQEIEMLFGTHKIPYRLVDIANNENGDVKKILHRENGKLIIPQVFVKDEYKASAEDIRMAVEDGDLYGFLGIPEYTTIKNVHDNI